MASPKNLSKLCVNTLLGKLYCSLLIQCMKLFVHTTPLKTKNVCILTFYGNCPTNNRLSAPCKSIITIRPTTPFPHPEHTTTSYRILIRIFYKLQVINFIHRLDVPIYVPQEERDATRIKISN